MLTGSAATASPDGQDEIRRRLEDFKRRKREQDMLRSKNTKPLRLVHPHEPTAVASASVSAAAAPAPAPAPARPPRPASSLSTATARRLASGLPPAAGSGAGSAAPRPARPRSALAASSSAATNVAAPRPSTVATSATAKAKLAGVSVPRGAAIAHRASFAAPSKTHQTASIAPPVPTTLPTTAFLPQENFAVATATVATQHPETVAAQLPMSLEEALFGVLSDARLRAAEAHDARELNRIDRCDAALRAALAADNVVVGSQMPSLPATAIPTETTSHPSTDTPARAAPASDLIPSASPDLWPVRSLTSGPDATARASESPAPAAASMSVFGCVENTKDDDWEEGQIEDDHDGPSQPVENAMDHGDVAERGSGPDTEATGLGAPLRRSLRFASATSPYAYREMGAATIADDSDDDKDNDDDEDVEDHNGDIASDDFGGSGDEVARNELFESSMYSADDDDELPPPPVAESAAFYDDGEVSVLGGSTGGDVRHVAFSLPTDTDAPTPPRVAPATPAAATTPATPAAAETPISSAPQHARLAALGARRGTPHPQHNGSTGGGARRADEIRQIVDMLGGISLEGRGDGAAAADAPAAAAPTSAPADGSSITVLTPRRASRRERQELGVESVLTSARRSLRLMKDPAATPGGATSRIGTPSGKRAAGAAAAAGVSASAGVVEVPFAPAARFMDPAAKKEVERLLEANGMAYVPNKELEVAMASTTPAAVTTPAAGGATAAHRAAIGARSLGRAAGARAALATAAEAAEGGSRRGRRATLAVTTGAHASADDDDEDGSDGEGVALTAIVDESGPARATPRRVAATAARKSLAAASRTPSGR